MEMLDVNTDDVDNDDVAIGTDQIPDDAKLCFGRHKGQCDFLLCYYKSSVMNKILINKPD